MRIKKQPIMPKWINQKTTNTEETNKIWTNQESNQQARGVDLFQCKCPLHSKPRNKLEYLEKKRKRSNYLLSTRNKGSPEDHIHVKWEKSGEQNESFKKWDN